MDATRGQSLALKVLGGISIFALAMGVGTAAHAQGDQTTDAQSLVQKAAAADAAGYIIVGPGDAQSEKEGTFYPTGPISDDTLVVIADEDGSLPGDITEDQLQQLVAQKRQGQLTKSTAEATSVESAVTPLTTYYSWSATSTGWSGAYQGGSLIGWNDSATATYWFKTASGYGQTAAGNGLGYYRGYNGTTMGTWAKYYGLGNATSTGHTKNGIPWGNVAAVKKFKGLCTTTTVCFGDFN